MSGDVNTNVTTDTTDTGKELQFVATDGVGITAMEVRQAAERFVRYFDSGYRGFDWT
jgi:hypothetical protein